MREMNFHSTTMTKTPIVWRSSDKREWKVHEMSISHMINISRQIINQFANRLKITPIPIHTQVAAINFHAITWRSGTNYLQMFVREIANRLERGEELTSGYATIWKQMAELSDKIQKIRLDNPEEFDEQFDWDEPIWD